MSNQAIDVGGGRDGRQATAVSRDCVRGVVIRFSPRGSVGPKYCRLCCHCPGVPGLAWNDTAEKPAPAIQSICASRSTTVSSRCGEPVIPFLFPTSVPSLRARGECVPGWPVQPATPFQRSTGPTRSRSGGSLHDVRVTV